jgi:hypothetical protein
MQASILESLTEIDAELWNACANPAGLPRNPFLRHEFLLALETSGSAVARTGWQPFHLAVDDDDHALIGVVPMYLKAHSQGSTCSTTPGPTPGTAPAALLPEAAGQRAVHPGHGTAPAQPERQRRR